MSSTTFYNSNNLSGLGKITAATFSGSGASLTNLPMGQATGLLAVANGGTGVTSSTGTGSVVLSASPTLTGTVAVASLNASVGITSPGAGGIATNTAIGQGALATNTTGSQNTALGSNALAVNTTGNYNVAVGSNTLSLNTTGTYNTAVGSNALALNTIGVGNAALGTDALSVNTMGQDNTAVGKQSLKSNEAGNNNVAVGSYSLSKNFGSNNTGVGSASLQLNTYGHDNTAIGGAALQLNLTGNYNVSIGNDSLASNDTGSYNVAVGRFALLNATAQNNTAIGYYALSTITTGQNNTAIGSGAGATGTNDLTEGSNNTLIGYQAQLPGEDQQFDNIIVLGNSSITTIYAQATTITQLSSDARDKTEVETIPLGLDFINQLRPVKYKYDSRSRYENGVPDGSKADDFWSTGFIAQEVMAVQPEWFKMAHELGKDHLTATPGMVLMPLLKAVQELSAQVTALQAQVNSLSKLQ